METGELVLKKVLTEKTVVRIRVEVVKYCLTLWKKILRKTQYIYKEY